MKLFENLLDRTPLTFGKHKGQTPEEVADTDPGYIVWLYENVEPRKVSRGLYVACVQEMEEVEDDHFRM